MIKAFKISKAFLLFGLLGHVASVGELWPHACLRAVRCFAAMAPCMPARGADFADVALCRRCAAAAAMALCVACPRAVRSYGPMFGPMLPSVGASLRISKAFKISNCSLIFNDMSLFFNDFHIFVRFL